MCDCYCQKCQGCDNEISIHIADFCVKRESVTLLCPDCIEAMATTEESSSVIFQGRMFICQIEERGQVLGKFKDGKYKGKTVLVFSKDPRAYGRNLN